VQERTAQLEAANRELESFTYSVSHDLRAPLRAMDGFSRILLQEYAPALPEAAQSHLHRIRNGAQRMAALIDDLLAFARLGRQTLTKQRVALTALAWQVWEELQTGTAPLVDITIQDLPEVYADPALLQQVLANLLDNARKFTRQAPGAHIEVGCQHQAAEVIFFVRDNGAGFDMRYVDKLFGVFQRLHAMDEYAGTGVGLAIVQRIIQRHGGRVWAEGEEGRGATFYFTLG
jgi:light-regulated signal transduction histidine kinase (bacteriophytochrome)